ncbi:tyrosine-type recombinase/integrase [uncultured Algoriphagus sp.]|uniref:tyrosine-type recombinase/integrase n=1 Tax=uncultured Algoriphagus sp. TaxID=417365 RepID=UPI002589F6CF|nr:tyrosine-type recombinase/integrase [uncultured Algoriphagus sp.]
MQKLFFLRNPKAKSKDKNTLNLRFRIKSINKMKNKGLGFSLYTSDWNQEEQRVRRTNSDYRKINKILIELEDEIARLSPEDQTEANIDLIVESVLKNKSVQEIRNQKQFLRYIFEEKIKEKDKPSTRQRTLQNYESALARLKEFEKSEKISISLSLFSKNQIDIINSYIDFERSKGRLDSTIKGKLKYWNGCITSYNDRNNTSIPKIKLKHFSWMSRNVEKFALNRDEITRLYHFAVGSDDNPAKDFHRDPKIIRHLLYFLFRCFTGMRISEMVAVNCNERSLAVIENDIFSYNTFKGTKKVHVPLIGRTLIFQIASELDFKFPDKIHSNFKNAERDAVNAVYRAIIGNKRTYTIQEEKEIDIRPIAGNIKTHTARRTFAQTVFSKEGDIHFVSQVLGHSSISVTQQYLGLADIKKFKDYEDFIL